MALIIDERLLEPDGEPEITENFNRVLGLIAKVLPDITEEDVDKILTVDENGQWVIKAPASGLPDVTVSDEGKFLIVNASGEWEATSIPIADDMTF